MAEKQKRRNIPDSLLAGGILLFTLLLYLNSLKNGFVDWDDHRYILENSFIEHLTPASLIRIFTSFYNGNYHPLTTITWAVEYAVAGKSAWLYHADNLLLHLLNILLVYIFVKAMAGEKYVAAIVALWFGIHPMHVESVAWISERKDLLYSLFFLCSLIVYLKYLDQAAKSVKNPSQTDGKARKFYLLALLFFLLSLLPKSAAVVLPMVMLLVDYLLKRKFSLMILTEKIPFFILALFFGILALYSQKSGIHTDIGVIFPFHERIFILNWGFFRYLSMLFVPTGMSAIHPYPVPGDAGFITPIYLSVFFNLAIFGLVLFSIKHSRTCIFGFLFFLFTIILVLQIFPVGGTYISERYTYIPYIGLFFIIASFMHTLWQRSPGKGLTKLLILIFFGALSAEYAWMTYARIGIWNNSEVFFTDVISKYPDYYKSYLLRGFLRNKAGNSDGALADFSSYIRLKADNPIVYNERGDIFYSRKMYDEALADYDKALMLDATLYVAFNNRGVIKGIKGDLNNSITDFNKAIQLDSAYADALRNRGYARMLLTDTSAALNDWHKAANLGDTLSKSYLKIYRK